jgi:hypothetical protein
MPKDLEETHCRIRCAHDVGLRCSSGRYQGAKTKRYLLPRGEAVEDGKTKQSKWISGKSGHLNIRVAGGRAVVLVYGYSPFDFFICHALSAMRYPLSAIRNASLVTRHSRAASS